MVSWVWKLLPLVAILILASAGCAASDEESAALAP